MGKNIVLSEPLITSIEYEKVLRLAAECLVEVRLIESRQEALTWSHEYEVRGEAGKMEKFFKRIRRFELGE